MAGVAGSHSPRVQGAESERRAVLGEAVPPEAGKDRPGTPARRQPSLPASGAAARPGHPMLGPHRRSRPKERDMLPDEAWMSPAAQAQMTLTSTRSSVRDSLLIPSGPQLHGMQVSLCPVCARPSPAPWGRVVGPRHRVQTDGSP